MNGQAQYKSETGFGVIRYRDGIVEEITLPIRKQPPVDTGSHPVAIKVLAKDLTAYFAGENPELRLPKGWGFDWEAVGDFRARVYKEVARIPPGRTRSYSEIAEQVGSPRAARAVGTAMATNPFAPIVPCHRVVRADGTLGGYGGGLPLKRKMLRFEGVTK